MFDELAGFSLGDFGLFWAYIIDEFSTCEAHSMIENRIESFSGIEVQVPQFKIVPPETLPRCFYRKVDGTEIVQVQNDRFTFNWTGSNDHPYPHFEATVDRFGGLFSRFQSFVSERGFGRLEVTQCEVVNVNVIPVNELERGFAEAGKIFRGAVEGPAVDFLEVETYVLNTRQRIMREGAPVGRLYTTLTPVLRVEDHQPAYRFELTARGKPAKAPAGHLGFFDIARDSINAAFMSLTTEWAHSQWGIEHA